MKTKTTEMTARQKRAANSKFKNRDPNYRKGNFEISALYYGNDMPQKAPVNELSAALGRFDAISKNSNLLVIKLIEYRSKEGSNEVTAHVLHQFHKTNQQCLNSKAEHIWRQPGSATLLTEKAIQNSGIKNIQGLEYVRTVYSDGTPWWETRGHKERWQ